MRLVNDFYSGKVDAEVKVKRDYVDEEVISDMVYKFLYANFTSFQTEISRENINVVIADRINVEILLSKPLYEYMSSKNATQLIENYLQDNTFEYFDVNLLLDQSNAKFNRAITEKQEMVRELGNVDGLGLRQIIIEKVIKVFGTIGTITYDLSTVKSAMQNCQIAGKVRYFTQKSFKSKKPDKSGNYPDKKYYTWSLGYEGNTMQCVYFPLKQDSENDFALAEDMTVVVCGNVEEYNGRINFKVKALASCDIVQSSNEELGERKPNDNYLYVEPQKVENREQYNFFAVAKEPNELFANNDVVVFDVETTGFDYKTNEIIEIGAVKLHMGEIVESFSCFVKPKNKIPKEITKLTTITNSMVANAYSINEVIVDFYKFCYGCVIVGYNIDFDYKFINFAALKVGYKFTNRQIDALYLARKEVKGAKNFKLSSICKRMGVSLEGAHRAINDATATAELLKLISDNVSAN